MQNKTGNRSVAEKLKIHRSDNKKNQQKFYNLISLIKRLIEGDKKVTAEIVRIVESEEKPFQKWRTQKSKTVLKNWKKLSQLLLQKKEKEDQREFEMRQLINFYQKCNFYENILSNHGRMVKQAYQIPWKFGSKSNSQRHLQDFKPLQVNTNPAHTLSKLSMNSLLIQPAPSVKSSKSNNKKLAKLNKMEYSVSAFPIDNEYQKYINRYRRVIEKNRFEENYIEINRMMSCVKRSLLVNSEENTTNNNSLLDL